jgi:glycopeptide antibiotics resistance protein
MICLLKKAGMQLIKKIMMEILPWVPVVALVRIMGNLIRKKRGLGTTPWHEAGAGIFFLYITAVINTTVPPVSFLYGLRLQSTVNLIPFHGISIILRQNDTRYLLLNIIGNIVMFIPFGFFTPLLWDRARRFITVITGGFIFSLLIEFLQFFISRGTDIDDLILNTAGTMIGYLLYAGFRRLFSMFTSRFSLIRPSGMDAK